MTSRKREHIKRIVFNALNETFDHMPMVFDEEFQTFVNIVERTAREWAEQCWEPPEHPFM